MSDLEESEGNFDYLESAEFDIAEGIKDLVSNIKLIKCDVDEIKKYLNLTI